MPDLRALAGELRDRALCPPDRLLGQRHAYDGSVEGWGHRLTEAGHQVVSIGKLHYRSSDDPNGSSEEILPLHVLDGRGDLQGMLRRPPPRRGSTRLLAADAGAGESTYLAYDRQIRDAAIRWLERAAKAPPAKPWVLFVSFVCPHFPRVAPPEAAGSAAAVRWHQRAEGRFGAGAGDGRD